MRTTITLYDRLAADLKKRASELGQPLTQIVNDTLRVGLRANTPIPQKYRLRAGSLGGIRPGFAPDKTLQFADSLEGEEVIRKLRLRK